jgi:hypothetical protein
MSRDRYALPDASQRQRTDIIVGSHSERAPVPIAVVQGEQPGILVFADSKARHFADFFAVNEEQTVSDCVAYRLVEQGVTKKRAVVERDFLRWRRRWILHRGPNTFSHHRRPERGPLFNWIVLIFSAFRWRFDFSDRVATISHSLRWPILSDPPSYKPRQGCRIH